MQFFLHSLDWLEPFQVDFSLINLATKKTLIKALGKNKPQKVLDLGAGFGADAFACASIGATVIMLENNLWIYNLLRAGLARGLQQDKTKSVVVRMQVINIAAQDYLEDLTANLPDLIYLDPMFMVHGAAKVQKYAQALRLLAAKELPELLSLACHKAKRVVVKRQSNEPPLLNLLPHHSVSGKNIRFDVY